MATPVTSIQTTTAPISQWTQCSQGAFCQLVRKYLFFPSNRMMTREKWGLLTKLLACVTEVLTIIFLVTASNWLGNTQSPACWSSDGCRPVSRPYLLHPSSMAVHVSITWLAVRCLHLCKAASSLGIAACILIYDRFFTFHRFKFCH